MPSRALIHPGLARAVGGMLVASLVVGCSKRPPEDSHALRVAMLQAPVTLNPRRASDASSQRIGALLFRALTRVDKDLRVRGDLATDWRALDRGMGWRFTMAPGQKDQSGQTIDAERMRICLENYRIGKPVSPHKGAFPHWTSTEAQGTFVTLRLDKPDPSLPRNITLLRYFTQDGQPPCTEPQGGRTLIGSGDYVPDRWETKAESDLTLRPATQGSQLPTLQLWFSSNVTTLAMKLLRGEIDALPNALTEEKAQWLEAHSGGTVRTLEREGVNVSYLAYNLRDPVLAKREVRKALALAIDRETIVKHKLKYCTVATGLLSPSIPDAYGAEAATKFEFNPREAERLLDQAGYIRGKNGVRLRVKYKTTPVREGYETGLMLREMLGKVGVELELDMVEPAVFLASVAKGNFQLYSSRWVGVSDPSLLHRIARSGQNLNRVGYSNPRLDAILDQGVIELRPEKRQALWVEAQKILADDVPYLPLWYWSNVILVRKGWEGLQEQDLSLTGALEPLLKLRYHGI